MNQLFGLQHRGDSPLDTEFCTAIGAALSYQKKSE